MLLLHPRRSDSGVYTCAAHERSHRRALARYRLLVIAGDGLQPGRHLQRSRGHAHPAPPTLMAHRKSWLVPGGYKDAAGGEGVERYCEQLWHREKRRQQKLRDLKMKQEVRKARVRRNNPTHLD